MPFSRLKNSNHPAKEPKKHLDICAKLLKRVDPRRVGLLVGMV